MLPTNITAKRGLLSCKGSLKIDTKKKYIQLHVACGAGMLWYYPKEIPLSNLRESPIDVIILRDMEVAPEEQKKKDKDKDKEEEPHFTFTITSKQDKKWKLHLGVDDDNERQSWISCLSELIDMTHPKVFETTIKDSSLKVNSYVPPFIRNISQLLMNSLDTEGIFRVSGNKDKINDIKELYNRGDSDVALTGLDPHLLTGVFKLFWRELSNPLIPFNQYAKWVAMSDSDEKQLKEVVQQLPEVNRVNLSFLMKFLNKVASRSEANKMHYSNLAIVFGPSILRQPEGKASKDDLSSMGVINSIAEKLISKCDTIFDPADDKLYDFAARGPRPTTLALDYPELTAEEKAQMEPTLLQHREEWKNILVLRVFKKVAKSTDEAILVIGQNRIYLFQKGGRLDVESHYLDVLEVTTTHPHEVKIVFTSGSSSKPQEFSVRPISYASWDIDLMVRKLLEQFECNFVGMNIAEKFKFTILPDARNKEIRNIVNSPDPAKGCGGFVRTYSAVCDYFGVPVQEDICWDVDNLFYNNDIKSFNLSEFVHKDRYPNDEFKTLMFALQYNTWFTSLVADGQKLGGEVSQIATIFKTNKTFKELRLANVGSTNTAIQQLADNFKVNNTLALDNISLSLNSLDDKSLVALATAFEKFNALSSLDISNCSVGKKGMMALMESLQKTPSVCSTLHTLNISGNSLDDKECSRKLGLFLGKAVALKKFNMSNTQPICINICSAFEKSASLQSLDISDFKVPAKQHDDLMLFLKRIPNITELVARNITITHSHLLGILIEHQQLTSLDISDNEWTDEALPALAEYLTNNSTTKDKSMALEELNLSRMYSKMKNKPTAIASLVIILENRPIKTLRIQGNSQKALRGDLLPLIFGLINNRHLQYLDVSGNQCGDELALALGKVIQHNKALTTLFWDDNGTTFTGLKVFKLGLERNNSLRKMPLPLLDMANILKVETDLSAVVSITNDIQQHVFDNALKVSVTSPSLHHGTGTDSNHSSPAPTGTLSDDHVEKDAAGSTSLSPSESGTTPMKKHKRNSSKSQSTAKTTTAKEEGSPTITKKQSTRDTTEKTLNTSKSTPKKKDNSDLSAALPPPIPTSLPPPLTTPPIHHHPTTPSEQPKTKGNISTANVSRASLLFKNQLKSIERVEAEKVAALAAAAANSAAAEK